MLRKISTRAKTLASATARLSGSSFFLHRKHAQLVQTIVNAAAGDITSISEIEHLEGDDAQRALDAIREILNRPLEPSATKNNFEFSILDNERLCNIMIQLSQNSKKVPSSLFFKIDVPGPFDEVPLRDGTCSCVYLSEYQEKRVALKQLRLHGIWELTDDGKRDFYVACLRWECLSHPNVVPLYGLAEGSSLPTLVLPWFERGNIRNYLQRNDVESNVGQRFTWISEVASGLAYLHKNGIFHGGLRGERVLVSDEGVAQLTDVTTFSFQEQRAGWRTPEKDPGFRWVAPEIFEGSEVKASSDVFSFALLCIEIFTAQVPFPDLTHTIVVLRILRGWTA
ncbi:hypothetical protein QCA50_011419 [Cerrena zonata]|uniref:Protein kinase domain-containing protein n=1 Tax=Cerrena zonata TaxID=2478898 RepID=A0AAW0FZL0_9APHY